MVVKSIHMDDIMSKRLYKNWEISLLRDLREYQYLSNRWQPCLNKSEVKEKNEKELWEKETRKILKSNNSILNGKICSELLCISIVILIVYNNNYL